MVITYRLFLSVDPLAEKPLDGGQVRAPRCVPPKVPICLEPGATGNRPGIDASGVY
jgi:hypothetical protein